MTPDDRERQRIASDYLVSRRQIIDGFHLTAAELDRIATMRPGDEVSLYAGHLEIQASIIADERDSQALALTPNIILGEN
jgi:hypothetical protein